MDKTLIIAEAGDNHNGDIELAFQLVDIAVEAKADYVKFQTFKTEQLTSRNARMAEYQKQNIGQEMSQYEMLKKLELPFGSFLELKRYAEKQGIGFLSSPFDIESIRYLNEIDVDLFKIPSGEITNVPYLEEIATYKKKIILSTGMSSLEEIGFALNILRENGANDISVLHCNTEYPTPFEDVNLKAMITIRDVFDVEVGYSDHTVGIEIPIAAVAMGAKIIEKHFTIDKNMEGPDHKASLEPLELKNMVSAIRNIEKSMGDGVKKPSPSELKNKDIARKSIVAIKAIKCGERFTKENLGVKRPGYGISPIKWKEIIGTIANKDYEEDELIVLS